MRNLKIDGYVAVFKALAFSKIIRFSLENYCTPVTQHNTSTKQYKIHFDLIITSLYTRNLVYKALKLCLHFKTWKLKIAFSSKIQNRTWKSQGEGLLQFCFGLFVYWNNFNCIFLPILNFFRESFWVNIAGTILGGMKLLRSHLWGRREVKMRTHANIRGGGGVMSIRTFTHNSLNLVPSSSATCNNYPIFR